MGNIFLAVLNMSFTGSFIILAICFIRKFLKGQPKIISYMLWSIAWARLIIPFSLESIFSLLPFNASIIPSDIAFQASPHIDSGIKFINDSVGPILPAATPYASANPLQIWIFIGSLIWVLGTVLLSIYAIASYLIIKHKLKLSKPVKNNIYESNCIRSPFLLGIIKPKIYIPAGLPGDGHEYIILHEQAHLRRHDHIVKLIIYFILCLHWFNPFVWLAFVLMNRDMEMSCDERVLIEMGGEIKKNYSMLLLNLATSKNIISGGPLAFDGGCIKERVKNIMKFKKPKNITIIVGSILVILLSVGFATNRPSKFRNINEGYAGPAPESILSLEPTPYVGNNSIVGKIINSLPILNEYQKQRFFSIGDNFINSLNTNTLNTLTLYYENDGVQEYSNDITLAPKNTAILFSLIENLEYVKFSFRDTPSGNELDKSAYNSGFYFSKEDIQGYLEQYSLDWDDFRNDWEGSVEKLYSPE
ncbi:MAG: DUF4825 domain-containing protein [Clostridiales bacterium]|jgi:beta-lactamase regulating signal transducer with metallopeptidase domain|nr:DUF4825 domain-containing protein [Clostridiales bacterium]